MYVIYSIYHKNSFDYRVKSLALIILLSEIFIFYLVIHKYKTNYNIKKIVNILIVSTIALYTVAVYCININVLERLIKNVELFVFIFCIIIHCINLFHIKNMNKYLNVNTIDDLKIIIINRLGKILIFATSEIFNQMQIKNILFFIIIILNIIYSYTIMKLLMRDMIKEPNENLYYNLVNEKNKNEEIVKYKTWAYESLMLIPVGIILCKKNEIIFINKKMKSYLNVKNENNIIGFNYEDLIISRSNKKNDNNFSKNDIRLKFEDKEFLGEEINLQGNEEDSLLNMIIIQDLNTEVQIEKLKNMLEQKSLIELGRNEMLSNLSHEFKTPVNVIYSTVQLLDLDKTQYNYEKSHEYNMIIKRNCDKLIRMINNFIDSTQFETNTINLDLKVINIVALVEDLTMSVLNFAKNKNIKVIFDTEEEEIYILADIDFIERIVLNILSNAIKYNRNNGNIFVNIKDKEEKVIIKVTDTGIGIPEEKLDKLFNRFERFDNNNLVHEEGTGLGLNIVKQMVDALNGEIKAISKINQGTTISVIFDKYNINEEQIIDTYDDMSRRVTMELSDI
ncbi:HAMP domain-containing sensor histidine kinase [Terrisporobacter mayombei]|uniref:sensor histidine kinase n=1 Tax=Terrisporobacter mayombei TaxID=1541 RepID=UPI0028152A54|nr:HAMP domain-containing sensor histidine kinase [Terrisporobacter mayombei]MCC3867017.1 HAMP domain-containing histidine kinase [Terrisporobacter mayombei]